MGIVRSEDLVILLDSSRSMFRKETSFKDMSRIRTGIRIIKEIIKKKKINDPTDRYSFVTFNGVIKQINEMFFNELKIMDFIRSDVEFASGTSLGEALAAALKLIIAEMRKIGEKVIRILVIGDGISVMSAMNPINLAKIAGELGIIIDAIRFGPAQVPGNVLKRITEITGGSYYFVNSEEELQESIIEVSKKKELIEKTLFNNLDNGSIRSNLLSEIAGNLLKLEELTPKQKYKIFQINPDKKLVCSICYSNNCINCETNFYGCGRFCPNCLTPFHLHCGMTWADQQNKDRNHKNKDKNKSKSKNNGNHYNNFYDEKFKIFRCVHCFYLLKIPVHNIATTVKNNMGNVRTAEKIYFKNASNEINTSICAHPECGVLFNESEDKIITRCNYCKSYFHEDCFNEYYKKEKICPYCNESVKLR